MQNEKVMAVTLMRLDLCNTQGYIGAYLTLPASRGEIQDALDRARIKDDQPYQMVDCYVMQDEELDINLEKASLDELNFFAYRISKLSEYECLAFLGCAMMDKAQNDLKRLINLTNNLVDVRMIPVSNDYELGEFFVENDFIEAICHIPPEYQEELLELFDYEKIGYKQRNAEKGIYHNGYYVMNDADDINQVYDGIHLPELPEEPVYVFKLQLTKLSFDPEELEPEQYVPLMLPATDGEILLALEKLEEPSLEQCSVYSSESSILALEKAFDLNEDIDKMNRLAKHIREREEKRELAKLKATIEIAGCTDINQLLDLVQNLDCYDFYPELSSMESYAMLNFLNRYHIPENDPTLKYIYFSHCDPASQQDFKACVTPYGIIRRNDREMILEYSSPHQEQQML